MSIDTQVGETDAGTLDVQTSDAVADDTSYETVVTGNENADDISSLKGEVLNLKEQLQSGWDEIKALLKSNVSTQTQQQTQQLTPEQFNQLYQQNPAAAMKFMTEQAVQTATQKVGQEMDIKHSQQYWDQKAREKFPLEKDAQFKAKLKEVFNELIASGVPQNSPKLVYTASEIAAARLGIVAQKQSASTATKAQSSGEAPRHSTTSAKSTATISDSDPRVVFYKSMKGKDLKPERLKEFKAELMAEDAKAKGRR